MSEEETSSIEEAFSASEDDWQPTNRQKDGESSDDDDSDFEGSSPVGGSSKIKKKRETKKNISGVSSTQSKKRKPSIPTLRTKLYNKYKPPPKTILRSGQQIDSPNTNSKTKKDGSDSDSSVDAYLVNPNELDLQSSFFNVRTELKTKSNDESVPQFDCNAGMNLSDSEDNEEDDDDEDDDDDDDVDGDSKNNGGAKSKKPFDFKNLLDNATNLEKAKENYTKNLESNDKKKIVADNDQTLEIQSLLEIGEKTKDAPTTSTKSSVNPKRQIKLTKTARQQKTQSKIAVESDSDWEDVADESCYNDDINQTNNHGNNNLEICVELPNHKKHQQKKDQQKIIDIEATIKRKLNREIKEKQINLHKSSLLTAFARSIFYNKLINNPKLMEAALKLLPSKNSYPKERTDIKYFSSFVTWYKTIIQIKSNQMYIFEPKTHKQVLLSLLDQIKKQQALCKQSFILIFIILTRAMGLQCRLIVNLLPLPLRPKQNDLCSLSSKSNKTNEKQITKSIDVKQSKDEIKKSNKTITKSKTVKIDEIPSQNIQSKNKIKEKKIIDTENDPNYKKRMFRPRQNEIQQNQNKKKSFENALNIKIKIKKPTKQLQSQQETKNTQSVSRKRNQNVQIKNTSTSTSASVNNLESDNDADKPKLRRLRSNTTKKTSTIPQFDGVDDVDDDKIKTRNLNKFKSSSKKVKLLSSSSSTKKDKVSSSSSSSSSTTATTTTATTTTTTTTTTTNKTIKYSSPSSENEFSTDDDFEPSPPKKSKVINQPKVKAIERIKKDRRVLSTDDDDNNNNENQINKMKNTVNMWPEVWCDIEEQWTCIDLFKGKVHCVEIIKKSANNSSGFAYVYAFQNDETIKDVTARYCSNWCTTIRKSRVEQEWLDEALKSYYSRRKTQCDILEDQQLRRIHEEKPIPTSVGDFKNHPLYALKRHLLKFQAIYPPEPPTLGFIRSEPIYPRDCVHTLHSRDIWLKQARVVKLGEKPYKIVKARPKWDRFTRQVITDQPLEIFGYWQTQEYEPPTAENGIVPRNAYGNVELFKKCMLPKKTVHLRLPGLSRICKKLKIDCAPAVIGFDFHSGSCHPTYDGFVICEEFANQVIEAWHQDQKDAERKEQEKYEARVYGNWKKLIRGLLIRERLKHKYNF